MNHLVRQRTATSCRASVFGAPPRDECELSWNLGEILAGNAYLFCPWPPRYCLVSTAGLRSQPSLLSRGYLRPVEQQ
jgi:hypothetical protein